MDTSVSNSSYRSFQSIFNKYCDPHAIRNGAFILAVCSAVVGLFILLAAARVLPSGVNAISSLKKWGYVLGASLIKLSMASIAIGLVCIKRIEDKKIQRPNASSKEVDKVKNFQANFQSKFYIHGTSSVIFAHLPKTEQKLFPVWDLLQMKIAPIGGKIFMGEFERVMHDGETAFARLDDDVNQLAKFKKKYSRPPLPYDLKNDSISQDQLRTEFFMAIRAFYLTKSLALAIRAKNRGIDLIPDAQKKESYRQEFYAGKRYFFNSYLFGYFLANFVRKKDVNLNETFFKECSSFLAHEAIDLSDYMNLETLPKRDEGICKLRKFFEEHGCHLLEKKQKALEDDSIVEYPSGIFDEIGSCHYLWKAALETPAHFSETKEIDPFLEKAKKHFELLEEMIFGNEDLTFTEEQKSYLERPFSLIFISNESDFIKARGDFRANHPLQLGKEITGIATEKNRIKEVQAYLTKYHIEGVQVVSFDTLRKYTQ